MALARLAADHQKSGAAEVLAVTIDHGLRSGSASEAARVSEWCQAIGLAHQTLQWVGVKPTSGVQEAARNARYKLLCEAALENDCSAVLTAHTRDDQAETVFMRLARSAMASASMIANGAAEPVTLMRPFLGVSRRALKATLKAYTQGYVSDPGNDDPTFERIKTRALLAALEEQNLLSRQVLLKTAERSRQACALFAEEEHRSFDRASGVFHHSGAAEIKASFLRATSAGLLLRQLIFAASGANHPPGEDQVKAAIDDLMQKGAVTLSGAMLRQRGDKVWIYREPAALLGRSGVAPIQSLTLRAGEKRLWDGRFILFNMSGQSLQILPSGMTDEKKLQSKDAPSEAFETAPALRSDGVALRAGHDYVVKSLLQERFFRQVNRFQ